MGTSSFSTCEENLLPKLFYIESRPYHTMGFNLGNVQIYRFKEPPYQFIMKYNKILVSQDPNSIQYIEKVNNLIQTISHRNLAKIHSITIKQCKYNNYEEAQMCIRNKIISTYVSYYTFTLQQVLMKRKSLSIGFSIGELWYATLSLIELGAYLQQFGVSYGCYHPNYITLSPQGYIKLYTHHITAKNAHALYYTAFDQRQNLGKFLPLPPQYLKSLQNSECMRISEQIYTADIFNIGMTILQMILHPQDTVKKYYLLSHNKIQFQIDELKKDLQSLINLYVQDQQAKKTETFITQSFQKSFVQSSNTQDQSWIKLLILVSNIIQSNPNKRWTFAESKQYIQSIRDDIQISGCIKMFDENHNSNHKKSFTEQLSMLKSRSSLSEQNNILKSIEINLTVTPIQRIEKTSTRQLTLASTQNSYQTERQCISRKLEKNLSHGLGVSLLSKSTSKQSKASRLTSIDAKTIRKPHQRIKLAYPR